MKESLELLFINLYPYSSLDLPLDLSITNKDLMHGPPPVSTLVFSHPVSSLPLSPPMSSNTPHTDDNSSTAVDEIDVPESSPSSPPAGWGLADRNWSSGWGPTSANGQNRESRISRSTNLRNLRADFSNAELTFEGRRERTTILDTLDTKLWASVQSYRCSDEARKGSTPYPTFTGPQVLQRLEEVQARLGAHIDEHSTLTRQMYETSNVLSALEAREKEVKEEIKALQTTQRELDALKEIAYARLFGYRRIIGNWPRNVFENIEKSTSVNILQCLNIIKLK
ncbi:hypothetical protein F5878DRAFT_647976, partial [Lentinula raphanica]